MIYIETGSEDVCYNFALEYYFTVEKPLPEAVFLFWRTTPTLMVGKYQNTAEEIDRAYAAAHGITVVRRLSGGGTIYTDRGGWQYTFIEQGGGEQISFDRYIPPIVSALRSLGAPVEASGRNDLLLCGRKISGNAQYMLCGATVHHGSLLFDTDLDEMTAATRVDRYKIESKSIKSVRDRVCNLVEALPQYTAESFKEAFLRGFLGENRREYIPTPEDIARIRVIAEEKFRSPDAVYGRDPRFSGEYTARLKGGKLTVKLTAYHHLIEAVTLMGDFFAPAERIEALERALVGVRLDADAVAEAVAKVGCPIFGVTMEELTQAILFAEAKA